jgi:BMFP domain-containing protein YqiC
MRFDDLALRLDVLMRKVAVLQGISTEGWAPPAQTIEKLEARLTATEHTVDYLVLVKTQEQVQAIVAAPADDAPVAVEEVVALSASADVPEAADIVTDVVMAQIEANAVENSEVAEIIAAAVAAVIAADPEVVTDSVAITAAITEAVAEIPAPAPEVAAEAAAAVAEIIAAATGEIVTAEVHQEIVEAVAAETDPELDAIEARLNAVEAKADILFKN